MITLTERFNRLLFQRTIREILSTPVIRRGRNPFAALTMVHQRDVLPYLLAIKTFAHYSQPDRIIVVADPSMDDVSKRTLRAHIPFLEIVDAKQFQRPALPIGGTWERLSAISIFSCESAIVQLDADTLTSGLPTEVITCMQENRSFIIRSEHGSEFLTLDIAAENGRKSLRFSQHIQAHAESVLDTLPRWQSLQYVRGCSGFTGFAKNSLTPDRLDHYSGTMRSMLGAKWDSWGSEQVSSNLLAARDPLIYSCK